jgi:hypothetical protein
LRCLPKLVSATSLLALCQRQLVARLGRRAGLALADRVGVWVGGRHQPIGITPVVSRPLVGLGRQLSDGSNRLGELAD